MAERSGMARGFARGLGELVPAVARPVLMKPASRTASRVARLLADWPLVAGAELAAVARPERVAAGVLTLACRGPAGLAVQHMAPVLMERINTHFGAELVQRVRIVADGAAMPVAVRRPRRLGAGELAALEGRLAGTEGGLREALARLGAAIAGERADGHEG